ncbi:MAG TPA: hypothetical protein VGM28_02585 [Candidatus Limnocylindrales bacterium]
MTAATSRALTLGARRYPVVLPSIRDPRLHVAACIISIHVLGQLGLQFRVTIPQILAAIITCAVIEVSLTLRSSGAFVWPASAMLTGSGVALILRTTDTKVGDPWGTNDWYVFAVVAGLALLTKYVIKHRGSHVFNPSNVGLVAAFLILGVERVQPLDFWWGPLDGWLVLAYAIIIVGGTLITRRLHLLAMAATYWLTLAIGIGGLAASGHCMTTDWAFGPVCGTDFWRTILTSPEVLIFLFFMLTDPKTIPSGNVARIAFAASVGITSTLFIAPQTTEFGAKVGLLASLVAMCVFRPVFDRFLPAPRSELDRVVPYARHLAGIGAAGANPLRKAAPGALAVVALVAFGAGIVLAGTPARSIAGSSDSVVYLDPTLRVDPASIPSVSIDPSVTSWDVDRVRQQAAGLALTLARNLAAEDEVLLHGDASLLPAIDHGDRLKELQGAFDQARATGRTTIERYRFDSLFLTVKLLKSQTGLGMAFQATGTQTEETYDVNGAVQSRREAPFSSMFVMRQVFGDDRWFNVGVIPGS